MHVMRCRMRKMLQYLKPMHLMQHRILLIHRQMHPNLPIRNLPLIKVPLMLTMHLSMRDMFQRILVLNLHLRLPFVSITVAQSMRRGPNLSQQLLPQRIIVHLLVRVSTTVLHFEQYQDMLDQMRFRFGYI